MSKKISKVQVTIQFNKWWESNYSDIFTNPDKVQVTNAVVYEGSLYLIYTYDEADFIEFSPENPI